MKFANGKPCGIVVTIEPKDIVRVAQEGISNGYAIIRRDMIVGIKYPNSQPENAPSITELKRWEVTGELPTTCTASMDSFFTAPKVDDVDLITTPLTARVNDIDYLIYSRSDNRKPVFVDARLKALLDLGDVMQKADDGENGIIHVRQGGDIVAVMMPCKVRPGTQWIDVARIDWDALKDLED
jgi:hypothetical protein